MTHFYKRWGGGGEQSWNALNVIPAKTAFVIVGFIALALVLEVLVSNLGWDMDHSD
jgi:hypothetical protein